jgi:thiol-disulfide isomerase/thioredoxin
MKTAALVLLLALGIAAGSVLSGGKIMPEWTSFASERLADDRGSPSLIGATGWLNTDPLSAADLRGKVVLVEFWTYSCINWLRIQPYVRAWADKYKEHGPVVVGAHTPEFSFEKNVDNIKWAAKTLRVDYPIAIDSDYAIWRSFGNHYWPALYFIDTEGRVRHQHFGEGDYERSERMIQDLLREAGAKGFEETLVAVEGTGVEAAADWGRLGSPETYVGFARADNFASPGGAQRDVASAYKIPGGLALNEWAFGGRWQIGREAARASEAGGRLAFRFHARDLNLVMGPPTAATPIHYRVLIDGKPPGPDAGVDVDAQGIGTAVEQRLYQLVRQKQSVDDRTFEIEFLDAGIEIFVFTFG